MYLRSLCCSQPGGDFAPAEYVEYTEQVTVKSQPRAVTEPGVVRKLADRTIGLYANEIHIFIHDIFISGSTYCTDKVSTLIILNIVLTSLHSMPFSRYFELLPLSLATPQTTPEYTFLMTASRFRGHNGTKKNLIYGL